MFVTVLCFYTLLYVFILLFSFLSIDLVRCWFDRYVGAQTAVPTLEVQRPQRSVEGLPDTAGLVGSQTDLSDLVGQDVDLSTSHAQVSQVATNSHRERYPKGVYVRPRQVFARSCGT